MTILGSSKIKMRHSVLIKAKNAGVNFLAYRCTLNSKEIKIEKKINILDD
mgnify:CR=1 FL=1